MNKQKNGRHCSWVKGIHWVLALVLLIAGAEKGFAFTKMLEYTDNQYGFRFQFPSNWKAQKIFENDEFGEIRVLLQGPRASSIMVLVDPLENKITRNQFRQNPNLNELIQRMMDFTVDRIYRSSSKRMNASKMIVVDKQIRPSKVGLKFYISTLHFINGVPLGLAGLHTIPFDKNHVISFVMSTILDSQTMEDNATFKRIFNSFHMIGDDPPPPSVVGGVVEQVTSWIPVVGEFNWRKPLSMPIIQDNLFLWLILSLVILFALVLANGLRPRRSWHGPAKVGQVGHVRIGQAGKSR